MSVPSWWSFLLLGLAAWRIFQLISSDDILIRPRRWLLRLPRGWQEDDPVPTDYRAGLAEFLTCVYCTGFWIAVSWWGSWLIWPHATIIVAVPFALSTTLIGLQKLLD